MAGSHRKSSKIAVSDQEVDSDNDMQYEDWQVASSKAPPTPAPRAIKKARKTSKKAKDKVFSLEIFLNMPLDLLAETCSHLDSQDLMRLTRTSKLFRSLLLAGSSRSIWATARRAAGLPEIQDLTETNYASWLYGTICMECGSARKSVQLDYIFLTRHCGPCRKLLLTPKQGITRYELHPLALTCASRTTLGPSGNFWKAYFLTSELMEINTTLIELQDADGVAQDVWSSNRRAAGSRTRKLKSVVATEAPESALDAFVAQRTAEVVRRKKQGEALAVAARRNEAEELRRFERERDAAWKALKLDLEVTEWLHDDIEWYKRNVFERLHWKQERRSVAVRNRPLGRPLASRPSNDEECWSSIKDQVEQFREEEESAERARQRHYRTAHHEYLQSLKLRDDFYIQLRGQQHGDDLTTFPCYEPFEEFASVRPLWKDGVTLDQVAWDGALEDIEQEVKDYRIATRVKAITIILAANNDVPLSSLSTDPADYPEDEYGDAFFSKLTSHFYCGSMTAAYPEALNFESRNLWAGRRKLNLESYLCRRHLLVLRAVLSAAGLQEDITSMEDVLALGSSFRWPDSCPNSFYAGRKRTALQLVNDPEARNWNSQSSPLVFLHEVDTPEADVAVKAERWSDYE